MLWATKNKEPPFELLYSLRGSTKFKLIEMTAADLLANYLLYSGDGDDDYADVKIVE